MFRKAYIVGDGRACVYLIVSNAKLECPAALRNPMNHAKRFGLIVNNFLYIFFSKQSVIHINQTMNKCHTVVPRTMC